MASLLFLFLSLSLSAASSQHTKRRPTSSTSPQILQTCKATRFSDTCQSSLSNTSDIPQNPTPLQIIQFAISISSTNLATAQSMVKSILDSFAGNLNRTTAARNCRELLNHSDHRLSSTSNTAPLPRGRIKNARAWMSAALLNQYDCTSALTNQAMSFLDTLVNPPHEQRAERDGFWERVGPDGDRDG